MEDLLLFKGVRLTRYREREGAWLAQLFRASEGASASAVVLWQQLQYTHGTDMYIYVIIRRGPSGENVAESCVATV